MSYILDSLKKSDKERRSADTTSTMVMAKPAFLENDKPSSDYRLLFITLLVIVLLALVYFALNYSNQVKASDTKPQLSQSQVAISQEGLKQQGVKQQLISQPVVNKTAANQAAINKVVAKNKAVSEEKKAAILLYQQALENKPRPEVDSLYQELKEKQADARLAIENPVQEPVSQTLVESGSELVSALESSPAIDAAPASVETVEKEAVEKVESGPRILSIYELDSYVRKDIPSVDYGAHIYATDNNSGFVILDGARRRVGDKLDSGLFVEKIQEESVVLSYNGTVFSLPAMKSWQGR